MKMKIYIPLSEEYYVLAVLPEPSEVGDEYYFRVGKWYIRYSKTENTFEIQGVKRVLGSIGRRLRVRA